MWWWGCPPSWGGVGDQRGLPSDPTCVPPQQSALEEVLEQIRVLKETVQAQEKRISDLENKLCQFTNGTD